MKTQLSKCQSQHLINLGVPKEKASELQEWEDDLSKWTHRGDPIFVLTDLIELLDIETDKDDTLKMHQLYFRGKKIWRVYKDSGCNFGESEELIDALYELLCWILENNYLKFNKDENPTNKGTEQAPN